MHINFSNNNVIYACVTQDEKSFVAVIPRSTVKFVTGHFLPLILRLGQVASKNAHKRDSQLPRFHKQLGVMTFIMNESLL